MAYQNNMSNGQFMNNRPMPNQWGQPGPQPQPQPNWDRPIAPPNQNWNNQNSPFNNQFQQPGQAQQQSVEQPNFTGRYIQNYSDIMPNEVPMDGRLGLFPTTDLSAIYAKAWTSNGDICTVRFIPDPNWTAPINNPYQAQQTDILRRLEAIEKSLQSNNSNQSNKYNKRPNGQKQDGGNNEA